jgi:sulfur-oxidizing protein SoxX
LRLRLVDASKLNPDTIMPPFYRTDHLIRVPQEYRDKPVLSAMDVEDVVAYLMTLK